MQAHQQKFIQLIKHPVKYRMFLFAKLPSAFFSGICVSDINEHQSAVTVTYGWFTKNPFRSTYFACLAMAAEMSTGLLAMMNTFQQNPAVSMLVVELKAVYHKKATGVTTFICNDGDAIGAAVNEAISTGNAVIFTATSIGKNNNNELIAEFFITWSFKVKHK